jgi:two-component system chemotaxis sensor kinase CheA
MDVVKTNMERIGGSVDVHSTVGKGTTFRVKIPLTLAIVPALIVRSAGGPFAIPRANVLELLRVEAGERRAAIEYVAGAPVYRLRGQLLPLVVLRELLAQGTGEHGDGTGCYVVVVGTQDRQFGLLVDDVLDTEDIVVKPLSEQLRGIPVYTGATILSDGEVALILDTWSIGLECNAVATANATGREGAFTVADRTDLASLLVVRLDGQRLLAIPLERVTRLEEVPAADVERVGVREALQYRGGILPIVRVSELVTGRPGRHGDTLQVVVYTEHGRSIGLVVDEIVDIVEESLDGVTDIDGAGVAGTAVVQRQVMEVLDLKQAVLAADPHFYDAEAASTR